MHYVLLSLCCLFVVGCSSNDSSHSFTGESIGDTIKNDYAEAFRIIDYKEYSELQIIDPASDSILFKYGKGEAVPWTLYKLPNEINFIAALSATHVGMIRTLREKERILGVSSTSYLCEKEFEEKWVNFGELGQSDPEKYVKHNPDLIVYSGFKTDLPVLEKLKEIGVQTMVNYDWKETHPLGRAEWIKVFGYLFECEKKSIEIYDSIQQRYVELVRRIQNDSTSPSVFVGTVYGDVFNVPAGESYMAQMLEDANAKYIYSNTEGTGSLSLSLEEVITENQHTDYWLNVAANSSRDVLNMNETFKLLSSFKNRNIYTYFGNVNCFWEESAVAPDKVLSDLINIFHADLTEEVPLDYYEQIEE